MTDKNNRSIWKAIEENALGQLVQISKGGKVTTFGYQDDHMPQSIKADSLMDWFYSFNNKGNLEYRQDRWTNQREDFLYDDQNRLTDWTISRGSQAWTRSLTFDGNGNIKTMTDPDDLTKTMTFTFGEVNNKPHALTSISYKPNSVPSSQLNVSYTDFKKIEKLTEGTKNYSLSYGVDDERRMSIYKEGGSTKQIRYYLGGYEQEEDTVGNVRRIHYISGGDGLAAIYVQNNDKDSLYYAYTDYQGSLIALTDVNGNVIEKYAYDPWGQRRNPEKWELKDSRAKWLVNRGYTMHEHLDAFGIINMNGRVYDPLTAMLMSPDPYVQAPGNWVNYNRYGYCMGNPLRYIDPSGYTWLSHFFNWIGSSKPGRYFATAVINITGIACFIATGGTIGWVGYYNGKNDWNIMMAGLSKGLEGAARGMGFKWGLQFGVNNGKFNIMGAITIPLGGDPHDSNTSRTNGGASSHTDTSSSSDGVILDEKGDNIGPEINNFGGVNGLTLDDFYDYSVTDRWGNIGLGVRIRMHYNSTDISNMNWVQTIYTSAPNNDAYPYYDGKIPSEDFQYYYPSYKPGEQVGNNMISFFDRPARPGNYVSWYGVLSLTQGDRIVFTMMYGFEIGSGKIVPYFPRIIHK